MSNPMSDSQNLPAKRAAIEALARAVVENELSDDGRKLVHDLLIKHAQRADGEAVATVCTVRGEDMRDGPPCVMLTPEFEEWLEKQGPGRSFNLYTHPAASSTEQLATAPAAAANWSASFAVSLHPTTAALVWRFAIALRNKLAAAEKKYGYTDGWLDPNWMDECRAKLVEHVGKGDPRDVAAYCALLWHHGERTALPASQQGGVPDDNTIASLERRHFDGTVANRLTFERSPERYPENTGWTPTTELVAFVKAIVAAMLTAAPSTAGAGSQTLTLTVREIQDLAECAGLKVSVDSVVMDEGDLDAEFTVAKCPPQGVRCEGEPDDPDSVAHYRYVAYCADYPDEGCFGLGLEIEPSSAAQGGKPL